MTPYALAQQNTYDSTPQRLGGGSYRDPDRQRDAI
jgi:hypothetical protein